MEISDLSARVRRAISENRVLTGLTFTLLSTGIVAILYFQNLPTQKLAASVSGANYPTLSNFTITVPTMEWGLAVDTFQRVDRVIKSGQTLSDLLIEQGVEGEALQTVIENAAATFNLRQLRAGRSYIALTKDSTAGTAQHLVYEPSIYEYVRFDLTPPYTVAKIERPLDVQRSVAAGIIENSLWQAMVGNGYSYELTDKLEGALQWSVDFHHLQPNEEFKLIYDQISVDGQAAGVGEVHAAYYKTADTAFYAIYYESEDPEMSGYYDLEGRPMKASFLKSPVKYSRISSYFNPNRFHPILKRRRPHYGTDYAAPYGTPILAVGDGIVVEATRRGGNGKFVKIRHNDTYTTQYLHMQGFARGIRAGQRVRQGQVIGYVGSTGLATGPHVCFRFWKNGRQINHLRLKFPPPKPLPEAELESFKPLRDTLVKQLNEAQPKPIVRNEEV